MRCTYGFNQVYINNITFSGKKVLSNKTHRKWSYANYPEHFKTSKKQRYIDDVFVQKMLSKLNCHYECKKNNTVHVYYLYLDIFRTVLIKPWNNGRTSAVRECTFCIISSFLVGNYTESTLLHRWCPTVISKCADLR